MAQLLPSPDDFWQLNFSGAGIHSPSECVPPLFVSIPFSDFQHPGPSWCQAALPALVGIGAGDLTVLPVSHGRHCPRPQRPRSLCRSQGPFHPSAISSLSVFSMSSAILGLPMEGFHWMFTLFLRRSARCSSWAQEELGSAPAYLTAIFLDL